MNFCHVLFLGTANPNLTEEQKTQLQRKIREREELLSSVYHSVAVHFADLHDTPARMMKKDVINDIVEWADSRRFFYWRFRRHSLKNVLYKRVQYRLEVHTGFYSYISSYAILTAYSFQLSAISADTNFGKVAI